MIGCSFSSGSGGKVSRKDASISKASPSPLPRGVDVLILKSSASLNFFGWKGEKDLEAVGEALHRLGVKYAYISEEEMEGGNLPCKILILSNVRCMKKTTVEGIKKFVKSGGKVLATYMSGYRDERNLPWSDDNNFSLSDVYGVDFASWVSGYPHCEYIEIEGKKIQLGRNCAMLVNPHRGVEVIGKWINAKGGEEVYPSAIVFNRKSGVIYCGEDIFAPENSGSAQVLSLIGSLLNKLSPDIVRKNIKGDEGWIPPDFSVPKEILNSVKVGGRSIRVGIGSNLAKVWVYSKDGVIKGDALYKVEKSGEGAAQKRISKISLPTGFYQIRAVAVYGKPPYIALYNKKGTLLIRSYAPLSFLNEKGNPVVLLNIKKNGTYSYEMYRGVLVFSPNSKGNINIINALTMNEYLAGVVPCEMPAVYPLEALKAMAVVSRTFAISQIKSGKHAKDGFDVCNTVHCQVYGGVLKERVSTNKAVMNTSDLIITYRGKPAFTPFFAVCGGFCASSDSVWQNYIPYLKGGFDGKGKIDDLSNEAKFKDFIDNPPNCYCKGAGRFRWKKTFSKKRFGEMVEECIENTTGRYIRVGKVYSVKVLKRASDGRVQTLEVVTSEGVYDFHKDKIRWITSRGKISTAGLPSTFFYVIDEDNTITFKGGGWGHGVGMCQEGAKGMAEKGYNFENIIKHYYQGVKIEKIKTP